jgi:large subunit ribosomal protein L9
MEVVLKQDFKQLGSKYSIVKVKPGYGRNYLIPQGIAVVANEVNKKIALKNARQMAHSVAKQKDAAKAIAAHLDQLAIKIAARAGGSGKIFGSVTSTQIANALKAYHILVDHKNISFSKPIKELGAHEATIMLHKEVSYTLAFSVVSA